MRIPKICTALTALLLLVSGADAQTCPVCKEEYDLASSLAEAEFILLVELKSEGPRNDNGEGWGGPDWVEVEVKGRLRGRRLPPRIKVNFWEGQCAKGFDLEYGQEYVLLVVEKEMSRKPYRFDVVLNGCGVKSLPVEDDFIIINGARWTVEEFESLL
ncbi:MAG: hypothetical protein KC897_01630 [Candidatus Omnitrophica bacterium]|nr:hypothetical protein [Candidatus Omnitrophota bacterium]MCB9720185.1 hypothetical protein [Candidatus Omnitrophota bacterium]